MPRQKFRVPQTITYNQADGTQNVFVRNEELGRGSFSIVYRVTHQNTNKDYAMKVISKIGYYSCIAFAESLRNEIKIQKLVDHPNTISLEYSFSDECNHYFVLEYCPGRSIREYLYRSENSRLKEPVTRKILKDVIQGLIYIHGNGITHYDIKLENFVIGSDGNVKIGDFGLSTFHKDEKGKFFSIFGTFNYLSPEMLAKRKREETSKVDIWAVGVCTFFMLTGRQPFEGRTRESTVNKILRSDYRFPQNLHISGEAKDFIKKIFRVDPYMRPSATELLSHPFLTKKDNETVCLYRSSNLPALNKSPRPITANVKPVFCPPPKDNKQVSPRQPNDDMKPNLCQPQNENKITSPRPTTANMKPSLCPPLNDNKQEPPKQQNDVKPALQKQQNDDLKPSLCQPQNENKITSPRSTTANAKPVFCPPHNDNKPAPPRQQNDVKPALQKQQNDDPKPNLCPPTNDKKVTSPRPTTASMKPSVCPPLNDNKPAPPRQQNDNRKPSVCPPLKDNKQVSARPTTTNTKPVVCPPLKDSKPVSSNKQNGNLKPSLCPPLKDNRQVSPRKQSGNLKPTFIPPPSGNKPTSPVPPVASVKPRNGSPRSLVRPTTPKQPNANIMQSLYSPRRDLRPISARNGIFGDRVTFSPFPADNKPAAVKNFNIPRHFVSRYCFFKDNLSYLLVNGTVGICFPNKSRIVMDPYEQFAQFYENPEVKLPEVFFLHSKKKEENQNESIVLLRKAARHFKKIRFSYDMPKYDFNPSVLLHNIKCFVKNDDSILFELDDMNFQVNFNDNVKLIIFWNDKKLCFFKAIREKCALLDLKNATSTNLNSDELVKFKNAKILLSDLAITIC
ncbi:hypothetical protein M9Y10_031038 [Tritrichomonas musculus]|uniref:Protein kinase domain-containing protein n=1 Tax=Tritrichomonas musculus TaxID=1915356 RepID=A0ABR2H1R7_9EUKA